MILYCIVRNQCPFLMSDLKTETSYLNRIKKQNAKPVTVEFIRSTPVDFFAAKAIKHSSLTLPKP